MPSGMPLDAGRDQGGIYRHIAREESVPALLDKGDFTSISWWDIVRKLVPPAENRDEVIQGNIVDTILWDDNGKPTQYIYTNLEGNMALKSAAALRGNRVMEDFLKIGAKLQPADIDDPATFVAVSTASDDLNNSVFLDKATLGSRLKQVGSLKSSILQCFVPSKGDKAVNHTYETKFWLDRTARHHVKSDYVVMSATVGGNRNTTKIANKSRANNASMEKTIMLLVIRIQRCFCCRVVKMSLEFVQDINGEVWLSRCIECMVAYETASAGARTGSPSQFKNTRIGAAAEFGDTSEKAAQGLGDGFAASKASGIGRHSDARVERRVTSMPVPDEGVVQEILSVPRKASRGGSRGRSRGQSRGGSSQSPARRDGSPSQAMPGKPAHADLFRVPGARLDSEVPIADSTRMFGSTQLMGCQGDFCKFDLSFLESQGAVINAGKRDVALSEFRQKLLNAGGPVAADEGGQNSHLTSMMKGHRDDGTVFDEASLTQDNGLVSIAYRSIMQARQEMPLIKLQLNRHKRGERGDYVNEENYVDIAVSSRLPAHYYKDVKVCLNCMKVYTIVSEAREKALNKMGAEKRKQLGLEEAMRTGAPRTPGGAGSVASESSASLYTNSRASRALQQRTLRDGSSHNISMPAGDDSESAFSPVKVSSRNIKDNVYMAPTSVSAGPNSLAGTQSMTSMGSVETRSLDAQESLRVAVAAIDSLTKLDVAEVRTMTRPPAAVEVVLEAVLALLTGKTMQFADTRRLLGGGEAFLVMLREFKLEDVSDARLRMVEPYVDNPVFRPENVVGVSFAASKFCAWVLGVVQAARWQRGYGHKKTDFYKTAADAAGSGAPEFASTAGATPMQNKFNARLGGTLDEPSMEDTVDLTFVQKLERKKAKKRGQADPSTPGTIGRSKEKRGDGMMKQRESSVSPDQQRQTLQHSQSMSSMPSQTLPLSPIRQPDATVLPSSKVPGHASYAKSMSGTEGGGSTIKGGESRSTSKTKMTDRERTAMAASQKKAADRLSSHNKMEGNMGAVGQSKEFRCADGITKMPYIVLGNVSLEVKCCNFIVIHDFFDTADATAIMFKQMVQRHSNMQAICFNYPGQSNTVWPRLPAEERARGAKEPLLNNDWIADRLHELLQHAEEDGDILLTAPFHLVGIGNGACIAAAFCQRWGNDHRYRNSLRSMVSLNGFLYPDAQLSSILHSAAQVFESTPHNRPDIPISYWSRFVFSEDYLQKVNPNLALNIYTAVSNPITNDGRAKITRGCLQHRDIRGGLSPDHVPPVSTAYGGAARGPVHPVQVPIIILQSTEDTLVSAANVDPFLAGRNTKHLWSHQLNTLTESQQQHAADPNGGWVGKRSTGPEDYPKYSLLGKQGLGMLLDTLKNPRGAFVCWVRAGHALMQENKSAMMDLLDALVVPTPEYTGLALAAGDGPPTLLNSTAPLAAPEKKVGVEETKTTSKMEVLFKIQPPKKLLASGQTVQQEKDDEEVERELRRLTGSASPDEAVPEAEAAATPKRQIKIDLRSQEEKEKDADRPASSDEVTMSAIDVDPPAPLTPKGLLPAQSVDAEMSQLTLESGDVFAEEGDGPAMGFEGGTPIRFPEKGSTSPTTATTAATRSGDNSPSTKGGKRKLKDPVTMNFNASFGSAVHTHPAVPGRLDVDSLDGGAEADLMRSSIVTVELNESADAYVEGLYEKAEEESLVLARNHHSAVAELPAVELPSVAAGVNVLPQQDEEGFGLMATEEVKRRTLTLDLPKSLDLNPAQSKIEQRVKQEWAASVPNPEAAIDLQNELAAREKQFSELEAQQRAIKAADAAERIAKFDQEQQERRKQYEDEDNNLLKKLQLELEQRRAERDAAERQRRLQLQSIEKELVSGGIIEKSSLIEVPEPHFVTGVTLPGGLLEEGSTASVAASPKGSKSPGTKSGSKSPQREKMQEKEPIMVEPVEELPPMRFEHPVDLPTTITAKRDVNSQLDGMLADEEEARKRGNMSMEDFDRVKMQMAARQMERDQKLRHLASDEQEELFILSAAIIQRVGRGYNGRKRARKVKSLRDLDMRRKKAVLKAQSVARGMLGRKRFKRIQRIYQMNLLQGQSVVAIQSTFRGFVARRYFKRVRRYLKSREIQRVFRGRLGRMAAAREKFRLGILRKKNRSAATIQSGWRMKVAREEFRSLRIHMLAVIELQRIFRGYLGRKQFARRREWEATAPGPERIKLGLKLIEESKVAFERQQEEIDALHRAQERAEARVSHIHSEMKDAEKELSVLERELTEIDQIERDLQTLSHEKDLLLSGISDAAGMPRNAAQGHGEVVLGQEPSHSTDPDLERRRRAEAYALEMTIQIKRAEREKKRQELETEFAVVFQEVEKKKRALERLEAALADMEATRERKDREFRRLQKNLMQLLLEQKQELDDLREKGIELETATAMTAAAATATALKAKEHEKRSKEMFGQTEELMKFQFMSMSLSYFSSLNMLKQLRDMNADTTASAVASSADAAAAAAASAAAANLPNIKKMDLGASDFVDLSIQKKKAELQASANAENEAKKARQNPLPENVKLWSVTDVCKWLDALFLGQYAQSFREAAVDGPFLMELREEDLVQVLSVKHKLHVRKILVSREKLKPLTEAEKQRQAAVAREESAAQTRDQMGVPDTDTVFSQARNSRTKRVEESLNLGFKIDTEDERGNTLLLLASQNSNKRLVEMLIIRGANVNHQNAQGNTALHFALAFDSEGNMGEYLIEHGADDTVENVDGLTCYDGLAGAH